MNIAILLMSPLLAILTCACAARRDAPISSQAFPLIPTTEFQGIIISAQHESRGAWTPTSKQVLEAEPHLQGCIRAKAPGVASTLSSFNRQYFGTSWDETRLLGIHFIDPRIFPDVSWRDGLVLIDDALVGYFEVFYDPETYSCTYVGASD